MQRKHVTALVLAALALGFYVAIFFRQMGKG